MKFLAILSDSIREAVDNKVFTVELVMSVVLVILVASISFTPVTPAVAFQDITQMLNLSAEADSAPSRPPEASSSPRSYRLVAAEPLDGAPEKPHSPYRVTIALMLSKRQEAQDVRTHPGPTEDFLREHFGVSGDKHAVEVASIRLVPPQNRAGGNFANVNQVSFELDTRPTRDTLLFWPHRTSILFGAMDLPEPSVLGLQIFYIEDYLVAGAGGIVIILLSVVVTSFFVPNMVRKGTIDLLLVRPLHRVRLLLFKYLGGVAIIFLNLACLMGVIWLLIGLRAGIWAPGVLLSVLVLTFYFAILYSVSVLYGLLSRNAIVGILITCAVWGVLFMVGWLYTNARQMNWLPEWANRPMETLHTILPRPKDIDILMDKVLSQQLLTAQDLHAAGYDQLPGITWGESIGVSVAFVALMLGLASWRFSRRDY